MQRYKAGRQASEPFKTSGRPFLENARFAAGSAAESETEVEFPSITKGILIVNKASNASTFKIRVHFATRSGNTAVVDTSNGGIGANILLTPGESIEMRVKCRSIFISTDDLVAADSYFTVVAELSGVEATFELTGEGIDS